MLNLGFTERVEKMFESITNKIEDQNKTNVVNTDKITNKLEEQNKLNVTNTDKIVQIVQSDSSY